jgi:hypothetical protein
MAWIPEPIYKVLPAAYGASGLALIVAFGTKGPAALSALTLLTAAGLTALWRHQHREENRPPTNHRPRNGNGKPGGASVTRRP